MCIRDRVTTYTTNEGQDQGLYGSSYEYKSTGASSSGGVPGTDSNGDVTDTMITDNGDSSSETILNKYDYLPNKTVQNIEHEIGAVKKDESSIAIVLTHYRVVKEETLESQGALDNMTFDEYVDANSNVTEQQVPTDLSQLVAAATEMCIRDRILGGGDDMTKEEEKYLFWLTSLSGLGLPFVQRFFERYKSIDKARSLSEKMCIRDSSNDLGYHRDFPV